MKYAPRTHEAYLPVTVLRLNKDRQSPPRHRPHVESVIIHKLLDGDTVPAPRVVSIYWGPVAISHTPDGGPGAVQVKVEHA